MTANKTSFKKGQSGNPAGRPSGTKLSARKQGANKLKKLLKALEGYADDSILVAAEIMQDETASQATRLKAAMELLKKYTDLTSEVYFNELVKEEKAEKGESDEDDEDEGQEDPKAKLALFSQNS